MVKLGIVDLMVSSCRGVGEGEGEGEGQTSAATMRMRQCLKDVDMRDKGQ